MKTLTFLFSFMFTITLLQAQNYQINFTGSGQSAFVDSIQVKNLTQGTTLSINGSDVLNLVGTVGINTLTANEKPIKLFPNPMVASTVIEFVHANTGRVCIEIFNEMGALIMKHSGQIQQGTQRYEISGLNTGIYTVNVSTADIKYAAKLISLGKNSGNSVKHQIHDKGSVPEGHLKNTKDLVQMQYNDGEIILLKGFAGDNASVLTLLPTQSQTVNFEFISCSDDDGNNYAVVTLGSQDWMAENLKYETVDSWWYDNNSSNGDIYGRLYTWDAAIAACPDGWHLPTDDEWKVLEMYLGMSQSEADLDGWRGTDEGKKLKSTSGWDYNGFGTDSVGFTALPGGYYIYYDETFDGLGYSTDWWTATENSSTSAWFRGLFHSYDKVSRGSYNKQYGYSVRCVRD